MRGTIGIYARSAIADLQSIGIEVLFTAAHHRRIVVLDRNFLWEGSLNVLSQSDSCEIMRRIASRELAEQVIVFIKLAKSLKWYNKKVIMANHFEITEKETESNKTTWV